MDTFIDKLAQKNTATDMINANSEAEARENKRRAEQIAGYEQLLEDMKQVNLKNLESAAKINEMLDNIESPPAAAAPVAPAASFEVPTELISEEMRRTSNESIDAVRNVSSEAEDAEAAVDNTKLLDEEDENEDE